MVHGFRRTLPHHNGKEIWQSLWQWEYVTEIFHILVDQEAEVEVGVAHSASWGDSETPQASLLAGD